MRQNTETMPGEGGVFLSSFWRVSYEQKGLRDRFGIRMENARTKKIDSFLPAKWSDCGILNTLENSQHAPLLKRRPSPS